MYHIGRNTMSNDTRTVDDMLEQFAEKFVGMEYVEDGNTVVIDRVHYDDRDEEFVITCYKHMENFKTDFQITPGEMTFKLDNGVWEVPE